ncbi:MAG: hypothetical protein ACRDGM_10785 [bacterium]
MSGGLWANLRPDHLLSFMARDIFLASSFMTFSGLLTGIILVAIQQQIRSDEDRNSSDEWG